MDPLQHLQTEARNPASSALDELTPLQFVRLMTAEDARVAPAVGSQAAVIARAIEVIADRMATGGRLVYIGAGTSGRLGVLDASECPPTFNVSPDLVVGVIAGGPTAITRAVEGAEDHPETAGHDLDAIRLSAADVLVGIATSGRTPYVLGAIAHARSLGAYTVGLSCNAESDLIPHVDLAITPVVGPEVLSGSTRLKAGTATKLVLNMLTTGAMVRLGKTFGNLMVDLRATNDKLRLRTNRIVRDVTGLDAVAADALLAQCNRELKTALVAHLARTSPDEARRRLRAADGRVRPAVGIAHATPDPSNAESLVVGIDGGGTRTVAILATPNPEGGWRALGRGEAGPSNRQAIGTDAALAALEAAVEGAFSEADVPRRPVRAACLGLAGAGRSEDKQVVHDWAVRVRLAANVEVTGDTELLLAAGTPDGWGIAVVAGTGSMAFARGPDARTARAGGWGHLLGDEGSGYAVAVSGLRAAARAADGRGPSTPLMDRFLAAFGRTRPEDLIGAVYRGCDRAALAALAPIVLDLADTDPVADSIITQEAAELAAAAAAAARQLGVDRPMPVALAGGMLVSSERYRERFLAAVSDRGLSIGPVTIVHEPAEGAVRMALHQVATG